MHNLDWLLHVAVGFLETLIAENNRKTNFDFHLFLAKKEFFDKRFCRPFLI